MGVDQELNSVRKVFKKNELIILSIGLIGIILLSGIYLFFPRPTYTLELGYVTIKNYKGDFWKGNYVFCLAHSSLEHEVDYSFILVMDESGSILANRSVPLAYHDYIYQVGSSELFYKESGRRENPSARNVYLWDFMTGEKVQVLKDADLRGHHELLINDGFFTTLRRIQKGGVDTIVEVDQFGTVVWEFSLGPYYTSKPCYLSRDNDWLHSNDVSWSLDGNYLINIRADNSFAKIDRATGEVMWFCGGVNSDFTLINGSGLEVDALWYHSHIIKEVKPNVYLMFDNDLHNVSRGLENYPLWKGPQESNFGGQSRLIEISLNASSMEASISWSYTPSPTFYCAGFGDIDVLPNGNILGTFGQQPHKWFLNGTETGEPFGAAMIEVNRQGELVREYVFPEGYAIYRMQFLSDEPWHWVDVDWITG